MRVLLDTNVIISAFVTHSVCAELFDHCIGKHELVTSKWILDEVKETLVNKFEFSSNKTDELMKFLSELMKEIEPDPLTKAVCRDADDDNILSAALSANVDCIITGDKDLLILKKIDEIPILTVDQFWEFEKHHSN